MKAFRTSVRESPLLTGFGGRAGFDGSGGALDLPTGFVVALRDFSAAFGLIRGGCLEGNAFDFPFVGSLFGGFSSLHFVTAFREVNGHPCFTNLAA